MKTQNVRRIEDVRYSVNTTIRSVLLVKRSEVDNLKVQAPLMEILLLLDKTLDKIRLLKGL